MCMSMLFSHSLSSVVPALRLLHVSVMCVCHLLLCDVFVCCVCHSLSSVVPAHALAACEWNVRLCVCVAVRVCLSVGV